MRIKWRFPAIASGAERRFQPSVVSNKGISHILVERICFSSIRITNRIIMKTSIKDRFPLIALFPEISSNRGLKGPGFGAILTHI
ncbi:MAG: hypothetical protein ACOX62_03115 [Christensenellales bacterium]